MVESGPSLSTFVESNPVIHHLMDAIQRLQQIIGITGRGIPLSSESDHTTQTRSFPTGKCTQGREGGLLLEEKN